MMDGTEEKMEKEKIHDKIHKRKKDETGCIQSDGLKVSNESKEGTTSKKRSKSHRHQSKDKCTSGREIDSHTQKAEKGKRHVLKAAKRLKKNTGKEYPFSKKDKSTDYRDNSYEMETMKTFSKTKEVLNGVETSNFSDALMMGEQKKVQTTSERNDAKLKDEHKTPGKQHHVDVPVSTLQSKVGQWLDDIRTMELYVKLEEDQKNTDMSLEKELIPKSSSKEIQGSSTTVATDAFPDEARARNNNISLMFSMPFPNGQDRPMLDKATTTHKSQNGKMKQYKKVHEKSKQDTNKIQLSMSDYENSNYVIIDSQKIGVQGNTETIGILTNTESDYVNKTSEHEFAENANETNTHGREQERAKYVDEHEHKYRHAGNKLIKAIHKTSGSGHEEQDTHVERKAKDRTKHQRKKLTETVSLNRIEQSDSKNKNSEQPSRKKYKIPTKHRTKKLTDDILTKQSMHFREKYGKDDGEFFMDDKSKEDKNVTKRKQESDKGTHHKHSSHKGTELKGDKETELSIKKDTKQKNRKQKNSEKTKMQEEANISEIDITMHTDKERKRKRMEKSKSKHKKRSHRGHRRRKRKQVEEEDLTEYFCVYHMTKYKGKAERVIHEDCEDVITAEDWDIGQKLEKEMRIMKLRHTSLAEFAESMAAERKRMVALLLGNHEDVEEQYLDLMEDYVAHLLGKQKEFTARVEVMHDATVQTLDDQIRRCKMVRRNVTIAMEEINQCHSFPEEQIVVKKVKSKYRVYKEILRREFSATLNYDYQFIPNPETKSLSHLQSIGHFYGYEQMPDLPKFPKVTDHTKAIKDIYIHNGETPRDTKPCCFTGCCFTSASVILLSDWNNACVKAIAANGTLLHTLKLEDDPWDVQRVNETTFAVTVPAEKKIYIIECNETTMEISSSFDTGSECFGLALFGEGLYVTCDACNKRPIVKVFSLTGQLLATLKDTELNHPEYIAVEPANRTLFISEALNDTVVAVTFTGRELFRYTHPELRYPAGIAFDSCSNVWICGKDSGNVHQITGSGELIQIVMEDNCHIQNPRAICFEPEGQHFIVTETDQELNGDFLSAQYE